MKRVSLAIMLVIVVIIGWPSVLAMADNPSSWTVVFNPTGTHIYDGYNVQGG